MEVDGLRLLEQIEVEIPLVKRQLPEPVKESHVGMKHQLVRWVEALLFWPLERHQLAHQPWTWPPLLQVETLSLEIIFFPLVFWTLFVVFCVLLMPIFSKNNRT